uniref:Uncharacterized protein n=1 Tax=Glossina austeni TaxID=7395 RepID=A0A1A9UIQ8_GLOAU
MAQGLNTFSAFNRKQWEIAVNIQKLNEAEELVVISARRSIFVSRVAASTSSEMVENYFRRSLSEDDSSMTTVPHDSRDAQRCNGCERTMLQTVPRLKDIRLSRQGAKYRGAEELTIKE